MCSNFDVEVQWRSSEVGQAVSFPCDLGERFLSLWPHNVQWDEEARRRGNWLQRTVAFSHWANILLFALVLNHSSPPPISGGTLSCAGPFPQLSLFLHQYLGRATGENMPSFHEAVVAVPLKCSFWKVQEKSAGPTFPTWPTALSRVAWLDVSLPFSPPFRTYLNHNRNTYFTAYNSTRVKTERRWLRPNCESACLEVPDVRQLRSSHCAECCPNSPEVDAFSPRCLKMRARFSPIPSLRYWSSVQVVTSREAQWHNQEVRPRQDCWRLSRFVWEGAGLVHTRYQVKARILRSAR